MKGRNICTLFTRALYKNNNNNKIICLLSQDALSILFGEMYVCSARLCMCVHFFCFLLRYAHIAMLPYNTTFV